MGRALAFTVPRSVGGVDKPTPTPGDTDVRLHTLFSGISTGTEMTAFRGTSPYIHKRCDTERRLFVADDQPQRPCPLVGWGTKTWVRSWRSGRRFTIFTQANACTECGSIAPK